MKPPLTTDQAMLAVIATLLGIGACATLLIGVLLLAMF
jgi:hypothetical protein